MKRPCLFIGKQTKLKRYATKGFIIDRLFRHWQTAAMTPEMLTIIGTGIALALLIVPGQRAMQRDIAQMRERIAKLEGLLEGLRDSITGRSRQEPAE